VLWGLGAVDVERLGALTNSHRVMLVSLVPAMLHRLLD
jgi:hypothetical protein